MAIDPPPPADLGRVLVALRMGRAAKLAVALDEEPRATTRQSLEGPFWWWSALAEAGRVRPCLTAFAGSPDARRSLSIARGDPGPWLRRLLEHEPSVPADAEVRLVDWTADPFAGGAYSAVPPGVPRRLPALERSFGRVALAGEHTAGLRWHGTLEGALRSGRRAANRVRELLAN
jgi:monoamine oxidase